MKRTIATHPVFRLLSGLPLTLIGLCLLMAQVIWGTLYQAGHGLFQAKTKIFAAWVYWLAEFIPLPGMRTVAALLFINLLAAVMFRIRHDWSRAGLLLIHYGLMMLLAGSVFAFPPIQESFLTLKEGEKSNLSLAYHQWELAGWRERDGGNRVMTMDAERLRPGQNVEWPLLKMAIRVQRCWVNCRRSGGKLEPMTAMDDPEENLPGGDFLVFSATGQENEPIPVSVFAGQAEPLAFDVKGSRFFLVLRLKHHVLPVTVKLLDFKRTTYPGSMIPRSFQSLVEVESGAGRFQALIAMNRPLRVKGYTFYQSAYSEDVSGAESSTLAVVRNPAGMLPYAATLLMFLGLVVHFFPRQGFRGRR